MSQPVSSPTGNIASEDPGLAMLRALVLVAGISGFLVVLTYHITRPMIEENKRLAIEAALFRVIPGAVTRRDFLFDGQHLLAADDPNAMAAVRTYAGYDKQGRLAGVAIEAAIQGYQDLIRVLYSYDPACQCIRGIEVLKMAETPGIGNKIATDVAFLQNFVQLDARLNSTSTGLEHEIVTVKQGSKTNPWEIDAITGATISSRAVGRMLNDSAQQMHPLITDHLEQLRNANGAMQ